jgi:hypothetical protein
MKEAMMINISDFMGMTDKEQKEIMNELTYEELTELNKLVERTVYDIMREKPIIVRDNG